MFSSPTAAYLGGIFSGGTYYLALHSENPGPGCDNGELSGGGYERTACPLDHDSADEGEVIYNSDAVVFPIGTDNLGPVTHWSLWDDSESGAPAIYGEFQSPVTWNEGTRFVIQNGNISSVLLTS